MATDFAEMSDLGTVRAGNEPAEGGIAQVLNPRVSLVEKCEKAELDHVVAEKLERGDS